MESRFLDSSIPDPDGQHFAALGHAGSEVYTGLEVFDNPGCASVFYSSDEVVAFCPITHQPDFYVMELGLVGTEKCIESKSLKLWLRQFNNPDNGLFCEALAVYIRDQVCEAIQDNEEHVQVVLTQKSRGGITIRAMA